MIIMPVPKDIRKFEPRAIGPLSKRQAIAVGVSILIAGLIMVGLRPFLEDTNILTFVILLFCGPILACGFIDVYGMPIWVYLKDVYLERIVAPKNLIYSTKNSYRDYAVQNKITYEYFDSDENLTEKEKKKKARNRKKNAAKRIKLFYKAHPELKPID